MAYSAHNVDGYGLPILDHTYPFFMNTQYEIVHVATGIPVYRLKAVWEEEVASARVVLEYSKAIGLKYRQDVYPDASDEELFLFIMAVFAMLYALLIYNNQVPNSTEYNRDQFMHQVYSNNSFTDSYFLFNLVDRRYMHQCVGLSTRIWAACQAMGIRNMRVCMNQVHAYNVIYNTEGRPAIMVDVTNMHMKGYIVSGQAIPVSQRVVDYILFHDNKTDDELLDSTAPMFVKAPAAMLVHPDINQIIANIIGRSDEEGNGESLFRSYVIKWSFVSDENEGIVQCSENALFVETVLGLQKESRDPKYDHVRQRVIAEVLYMYRNEAGLNHLQMRDFIEYVGITAGAAENETESEYMTRYRQVEKLLPQVVEDSQRLLQYIDHHIGSIATGGLIYLLSLEKPTFLDVLSPAARAF